MSGSESMHVGDIVFRTPGPMAVTFRSEALQFWVYLY